MDDKQIPPEELRRFRELGPREAWEVGILLESGECATVEEALTDLRERRAAHEEALRRRRRFRTV